MIQKINLRNIRTVLIGSILLAGSFEKSYGQSTIDIETMRFGTTQPDRSFNINGKPEWINCDSYNDMQNITLQTVIGAASIAWDEFVGGTWHVKIYIYDEASGYNVIKTITDAKHPDVVILDPTMGTNSGSPGDLVVAVVYEDLSGSTPEIKLDYVDCVQFMGVGSLPNTSGFHGPFSINSGNGYVGMYPHIDAFQDDLANNNPYYSSGGFANYSPLNHFVITWTEDNSGTKSVYVEDGYFSVGAHILNNNIQYIGNGEKSDIAGVRLVDGSLGNASVGRFAHVVYVDASGDLIEADYDIDNNIVNTITLESNTIIGYPRIDAPNVRDDAAFALGTPSFKIPWKVVAQIFNGTDDYVHVYDNYNFGFTGNYYTDLESYVENSLGTLNLYEMFSPAVSAGPGSFNLASPIRTPIGRDIYQIGLLLDAKSGPYLQHIALEDHINGASLFGTYDINTNSLNSTASPFLLATSISPNAGNICMAAWNNYDNTVNPATHIINWKFEHQVQNIAYKPAATNIQKVGNNVVIISPNPATTVINVTGVKGKTTYTITDVTGRLVQQGSVSDSNAEVNIANLIHGMYILNFDENGDQQQFKLIKQ